MKIKTFRRRALPAAAALAAHWSARRRPLATSLRRSNARCVSGSRGWSACEQRAEGTGTVSCEDGTSLPVVIHARGAGLSAGKSTIKNGTGTFTEVHRISQVLGSYARARARKRRWSLRRTAETA